MRKQSRLPQYQLAHAFQVLERGFVAEVAEGFAHLRKQQLRLVAKTEERLRAAQALALARDFEDLVGRHGMGARIAGIAPEGAVAAIVAAQVGQRQEDLAGVGHHGGLEALFCGARRAQEPGKIFIGAADPLARSLARQRKTCFRQILTPGFFGHH